MKHYFYFKKGQSVPQWLLRVRDDVTVQLINAAEFKTNGKVMLDDNTGIAVIWPASKRFSCVVSINGHRRALRVDAGENECHNHIFEFDLKRYSPLSLARRHGYDIYTTTKCKPLPPKFNRIANKEK